MDEQSPDACPVAFIGAGAMAREHARAFGAVAGVELAGIHSRTFEKARSLGEEFGIRCVCHSIDELYERTEASLVVIAVPEMAANAVAKTCFRHPWSILAEKPLGYDLADAQDIAAAAEAYGSRVLVGLNRRFLSSTQAALADLNEQEGPRFIQVHDQQSLEVARQIGHPEPVVENWMFANSIHLIDYVRALGRGAIESVKPIIPWNGGSTDVVVAVVDFDSGDRALYQGVWGRPGPWMVTATVAARRWELRPLEKAAFQNAGERTLQPVETHAWDTEFKPGFRLQAQMAVASACGRPSEAVTLAESMETMKLVSAIYA